jgi:hypothetical protein
VHLKPVLAGEVVIDSRESRLYKFLRTHYNDAVAVEMEGVGLANAAHAAGGLPAMVVRGISDRAGQKTQTDAAGWQPCAAERAAAFAVELLATLNPNDLPPRRSDPDDSEPAQSTELHEPSHAQSQGTAKEDGKVTYLSAARWSRSKAGAGTPNPVDLHDLVTTFSESAELVTTSYQSHRTDYTWTRLDLLRQLEQVRSQLDEITRWLGHTDMNGELSTFELRHALRRYDGLAEIFIEVLQRLEPGQSMSVRSSYLDSYKAASRSLEDLLWQIYRALQAAQGGGPRPFGSK